jgi:hypothetical protein
MNLSDRVEFQETKVKVVPYSSIIDVRPVPYVEVTDKIVDAVKCFWCDKVHLVSEDNTGVEFLTIIGNVHINMSGGVLGNSDWDKYGVSVTHYCVTEGCLEKQIKSWMTRGE